MKEVIAIVGPTATGKTEIAIDIAKELDGEIVSCDSMQLYKYMDIGSAKPTLSQRSEIPHHLIDIIDPKEKMSVYKYRKLALNAINDIISRGKIPVLCGGTGLYLNSLIYDMDFAAEPDDNIDRENLYMISEQDGPERLYEMLCEISPESAERIHPNNVKRVVRAIEAARSGKPVADISSDLTPNPDFDIDLIGITRDREELYDRIDMRVDKLMTLGLEAEVRSLIDRGLTASDISMKGIGYKEMIAYFDGEYDLNEAIRLIKRNTRHYAKRQMTWFKRYDEMKWFNASEHDNLNELERAIITWLKR